MRKIVSMSIATLLASLALAGCATNGGDGGGPGTRTAPSATVTATPLAPEVGQPVTFEASATNSDTVTWGFGDGETGTGQRTTHTYSLPGQYIVTLNVTNEAGRSANNDAALTYLTVTIPQLDMGNITEQTAPLAVAASSAQVIQVGGNVSFDASDSGAWVANPAFDPSDPVQNPSHNPPFEISDEGVTMSWDFGDGQTGEGVSVSHAFDAAGLYPVRLTVTDSNGLSSSYVISVRVLPQEPPTPGVRNPTVITDVSIAEPESLDPAFDYETAGGHIISHVYETLYSYDRDSTTRLVPVLAAAMPEYNQDRTELTIRLREGVRFHDGTELTAEDVKFSLDRVILMNDPGSPAKIFYSIIKGGDVYGKISPSDVTQQDREAYLAAGGVEVVDPQTVKIRLQYANPSFLYRLAFQAASIVSKDGVCAQAEPDFVDCLPPPGETRHPWMDTHEVGSGPYTLEAWIPGQQIILKRFEDYWGEKPTIEKVIRQRVDNINTRLLMLRSGQADSVYVPVDHADQVVGMDGVRISENPSWSVSFIAFNQAFCGGPGSSTFQTCMNANRDDAPTGADGEPDALFFSDVNMRKAWTYAFDYDTFYRDILKEHGRMLNGPLPKGIFAFDESIPQPKRDMDVARAAFQQTQHADGFSITLFYNSGNTVREAALNLLAQNLRELGPNVNVEVRGLDFSTSFLPKLRAQALPVLMLGWAPDYAFPDNYVPVFGHSQTGFVGQLIGYSNPELNEQLDQLARESDEQALQQGYSDAVRTINEEFLYIWLHQGTNFAVHRDWVKGYYFNPMNPGEPNIGDYTTITKG